MGWPFKRRDSKAETARGQAVTLIAIAYELTGESESASDAICRAEWLVKQIETEVQHTIRT